MKIYVTWPKADKALITKAIKKSNVKTYNGKVLMADAHKVERAAALINLQTGGGVQ